MDNLTTEERNLLIDQMVRTMDSVLKGAAGVYREILETTTDELLMQTVVEGPSRNFYALSLVVLEELIATENMIDDAPTKGNA